MIRRYVPESPRWREEVGRIAEANRVTSNIEQHVIAANNGKPLPQSRFLKK